MGFFKRFEPGQGAEDVMQTPPEGYEVPVISEAELNEAMEGEQGDRVRRAVANPRTREISLDELRNKPEDVHGIIKDAVNNTEIR